MLKREKMKLWFLGAWAASNVLAATLAACITIRDHRVMHFLIMVSFVALWIWMPIVHIPRSSEHMTTSVVHMVISMVMLFLAIRIGLHWTMSDHDHLKALWEKAGVSWHEDNQNVQRVVDQHFKR